MLQPLWQTTETSYTLTHDKGIDGASIIRQLEQQEARQREARTRELTILERRLTRLRYLVYGLVGLHVCVWLGLAILLGGH